MSDCQSTHVPAPPHSGSEYLRASCRVAGRLLGSVLAVVFPSACRACGRWLTGAFDAPLCESCWTALPRQEAARCGCGLPLPPGRPACGRCQRSEQPFVTAASIGRYEGALRTVVHELKYGGRRRSAERVAQLLLQDRAVRLLLSTSDILVPVPLHPRRLRVRGFNQSRLLARALARGVGAVDCAEALVRRRDTIPQAGLSATERRDNVREAFAVRRRALVAGRVVTLVDDVTTTGATAQACARALIDSGATELRLVTIARA